MSYIRLPPTVSKVQAANRVQRIYLQQWQTTLSNYEKWCPQLKDQIKILSNIIQELSSSIKKQDELIQQRIQLQAALESPGLVSVGLVKITSDTQRIPDFICFPSLVENKTHQSQPRPHNRKINEVSSQSTPILNDPHGVLPVSLQDFHPLFHQETSSLTSLNSNAIQGTRVIDKNRATVSAAVLSVESPQNIQAAERLNFESLLQDPRPWSRIPRHLQAFPSIFEQLTKSQEPSITSSEWSNRFAPLYREYLEVLEEPMDSPFPASQESPRTVQEQTNIDGGQDAAMTESQLTQDRVIPNSHAASVDIDVLKHLIDVPLLDPSRMVEKVPTFAEAVQVIPKEVHKVRFECHINKFPKNTPKVERITHVLDVARRYDKSACLYPSGKEQHPPLSSAYEIKNARLHRYFQDKPGAQSPRYANSLYGFFVIGITGDVDDFELAMKDWAISQRHELVRQGVSSNSLIVGFLTQGSVTTNRDDCVNAIKATPQWVGAGCPDFSIKTSMLWGTGGSAAKVPALCLECDRTKIEPFVKMCEALFFGENISLPTMLREVLFFPSRSFAPNHPVRLTYINSQYDFISSERTITCEHLGDIYQQVRLKCDPSKRASLEDILLRLTGVSGPLFRSMDRTVDNKTFLKLDVTNLDAWAVRRSEVEEFLKHTVHPDDHNLVFRNATSTLAFSEPWAKFVNGRMSRNVLDVPSKESIEYVGRCTERLTTPQTCGLKKRAHASVSSGSNATITTSSSTASQRTHPIPTIDLTEDSKSASSPNHKVHVVEQRSFQHNASPISSIDGSATTPKGPPSPNTVRMQKLEDKVASHDTRLTDIQRTVTSLDEKIVTQHSETTFNFNKFSLMLNTINENILASATITTMEPAVPAQDVPEDMVDEYKEFLAGAGAFNPNEKRSHWNQVWKEDQAHRSHVQSRRIEYAESLRRDAEHYGETFDHYAAAYERYPSPPPIDYPDDTTFMDD